MTLTLADIEIWDDAAVDQVFVAATARAEGAQSAGDTVGDLLSFIPWHGRVAAAAQSSAHLIKISLRDHEDQCRRVAAAARKAAAEIADLKYRLSMIRVDAREAFIRIDDHTGKLTTKPAALTIRQSEHQRIVLLQLPTRIRQLLDDADDADRDLATAIGTADGTTDFSQTALPTEKPPPESSSPADRKKWWDNLTPLLQLDQLAQDPAALDRDGIPVENRDAANRMRLARELAAAKGALTQATHEEAAYWEHVNTHHGELPPGMTADPVAALGDAQVRYDDLLAIQRALGPKTTVGGDRRSLIMLDTRSDPRRVLGVIGVGDVDHAAHVSVTTGGVSTDAASLPQMVDEATNLRRTTSQILEQAGDPHPESVATVAWVGYLPPASMVDIDVAGDGVARAAAPRLNSFVNGLAATSANPHQEITAFGHSYGSLVTSLALQQGPMHGPVHNVVFYGSPGLEIRQLSDLHLAPGGHAYYEQAAGDPITWVQRGPKILDAFPLVGRRLNLLFGSGDHHQRFGDTPNEIRGIGQLSTSAGPDAMNVNRTGATGHSQYTRDDGTSGHALRMSGYNLAAVLSGVASAPKLGR